MAKRCLQFALVAVFAFCGDTMNNGLARTPPMGWLSWERFRCRVDCDDYPDSCINEKLYMDMADRIVKDGWKDAGYEFVNIDDCWSTKERNEKKQLVPDPKRFPNGIAALADYMHQKGLKLGIYADYGTTTCQGYPGTMGYEKIDAQTFADWGVDMLKLDGCASNAIQKAVGYPLMSKELNATGRPIVYLCRTYLSGFPPKVNYTELGEYCNLWRNYNDVQDSFDSVINIINWWGDNQADLIPAAGPGNWNDPDMIVAGDYSLSSEESKVQFGMWAILAAPLFLSNDLRKLRPDIKTTLQNREVIAVNQDVLGNQGRRVTADSDQKIQLWMRPLVSDQLAIAVFSTRTDGIPYTYKFKLADLGIEKPHPKYSLMDLFDEAPDQNFGLNDIISVDVNPNGIKMFRATPIEYRLEKYEFLDVEIL